MPVTIVTGKAKYRDSQGQYHSLAGTKGDPSDIPIDDTAGSGDTDKLWSANKVYTELAEKISEPANEGTNGQVLATDGQGGRYWMTIPIMADATGVGF